MQSDVVPVGTSPPRSVAQPLHHELWTIPPPAMNQLTPRKARDLFVECFHHAQHEVFARAPGSGSRHPTDDAVRTMVFEAVRMAFEAAGADFEAPTAGALRSVLDVLTERARSWGTPDDIIEHHRAQLLAVLDALKAEEPAATPPPSRRQRRRYGLFGAAFGVLFPLFGTILEVVLDGIPLTFSNVVALHAHNPLLLIIDTAPFWLGLFASIAGARQDALEETMGALERVNARLASANAMLQAINENILTKLKETNTQLEAQNNELEDKNRTLVQLGQAKSQFVANMSHEIRTPLTALLGFADLLATPALKDSDRLNYALIIRRNGEHLLSVINDILDMSKVEAGKLEVERIPMQLGPLLADVDSLMRPRTVEKGLAFDVRLDTPVPSEIVGDPTRLRQVLLNLVGNAVKFTQAGSVRLSARFDAKDATLAFTVADTGIGIAPEQVARLFEPFQQADASMSRRFGGSGLGLSICKALAESLGGTITVESKPGAGSVFTFTLRLGATPEAPMLTDLAAVTGPNIVGHQPLVRLGGRVLVAEDGLDNQVLITTLLRKAGTTPTVVANGAAAVDAALAGLARGEAPDLILMDMQMPVLDGYQATAQLRAKGYDRPIVALTANAMMGERERCIASGCNDFLSKPIAYATLVDTIAKYFTPADAPATATTPIRSEYADDADMRDVVSRFSQALSARVREMREALTAPTLDTLQRLAHQLRGAAGGYGYPQISIAAAELEDAIRAKAERATLVRRLQTVADLCSAVVIEEQP